MTCVCFWCARGRAACQSARRKKSFEDPLHGPRAHNLHLILVIDHVIRQQPDSLFDNQARGPDAQERNHGPAVQGLGSKVSELEVQGPNL